ncbi:hypothetical protein CLAFUW4_05718 [Fulvia fulva]|nr:hypothetical protein CLAFUR4_05712 [Fulvia fulva]WPV15028.1 hypothetical protein CLAFUW4_05718 [Fulvia fulva]WPV30425.1 hypothetical protein CLAFUW7_05716 [Fulvia fulva]
MSQALASLPRSESKARFMVRIGLDIRDPRHRQIYNLIKDEASDGRSRIMLLLGIEERSQHHDSGHRRLSGAEIPAITTSGVPEQVMNNEINQIYLRAGPATKILYQLALDPDHPNDPNWIIRWMLWHVFRYRDGRQSRLDTALLNGTRELPSSEDEGVADQVDPRLAAVQRSLYDEWRYDPVRDRWNR